MTAMTALVMAWTMRLTAEFGGKTRKGLVFSFLAVLRAVENFETLCVFQTHDELIRLITNL